MLNVEISVDTSKLESIIAKMDGNIDATGKLLGQVLEGYAKSYAPFKTGALISSIHQEYPGGDVLCRVAPAVDYAIYQELGTYKMAAHPFLAPAIESMIPLVLQEPTWSRLFQ